MNLRVRFYNIFQIMQASMFILMPKIQALFQPMAAVHQRQNLTHLFQQKLWPIYISFKLMLSSRNEKWQFLPVLIGIVRSTRISYTSTISKIIKISCKETFVGVLCIKRDFIIRPIRLNNFCHKCTFTEMKFTSFNIKLFFSNID